MWCACAGLCPLRRGAAISLTAAQPSAPARGYTSRPAGDTTTARSTPPTVHGHHPFTATTRSPPPPVHRSRHTPTHAHIRRPRRHLSRNLLRPTSSPSIRQPLTWTTPPSRFSRYVRSSKLLVPASVALSFSFSFGVCLRRRGEASREEHSTAHCLGVRFRISCGAACPNRVFASVRLLALGCACCASPLSRRGWSRARGGRDRLAGLSERAPPTHTLSLHPLTPTSLQPHSNRSAAMQSVRGS